MALKKYFPLNNNLEIPENCKDRCFKIRPLIEKMNENFLQFGYFSSKYSVDEKIVGYYGRHPIKQFVRGKPVRFGFKEWALCSTSGYTYKFFVYQGANAKPRPKNVLLGTDVVLNVLEKIPAGVSDYFDNFFTDMDWMKSLTELGIKASGTVRLNRLRENPFRAKKGLIKKEKGFLETVVDAISWLFACLKNNSIVSVLSNVDGVNPMKHANRRGQLVQVPECITKYNAGKLGVDMADWKTQKYTVGIKSKKWYFSFVTHCLDVAVVNSHILYSFLHSEEKMDLLDFRVYVTTALLRTVSNSKPKKPGVEIPLNNNLEIPENCKDRCFKIRPLIEKMNKNFLQFGYFSSKYSVDEKIVGYCGRLPIKQFVRGKPVRYCTVFFIPKKKWTSSTSGCT